MMLRVYIFPSESRAPRNRLKPHARRNEKARSVMLGNSQGEAKVCVVIVELEIDGEQTRLGWSSLGSRQGQQPRLQIFGPRDLAFPATFCEYARSSCWAMSLASLPHPKLDEKYNRWSGFFFVLETTYILLIPAKRSRRGSRLNHVLTRQNPPSTRKTAPFVKPAEAR
jgi:hypothetical protein